MDFTTEIASFQGALLSADNVYSFTTLSSKGGNEEKIKYVMQGLKRFLKAEKYIDDNGLIKSKMSSTRKFAMYIILNTDLEVLDAMVHITEIEPLIWSITTVPKYLMCEMMWQLHLEPFVYELIPKCWPEIGLEVAQAFLENFKYLNPTDCLDKLSKITSSCYSLLCRTNSFKLGDSLLSTVNAISEIFQKFLKYYTKPPNKHKLDALSNDALYEYKGKRIINILHLVYDCISMFTQNASPLSDDPIYRVTYSVEYLHNLECKVCESPCELVVEHLNNSNKFLLDIFQNIVMDISVDIYCAWSEFEDDGKSMQQAVGELCDKVHMKLQSTSSVAEHPVLSMIQMMARKPIDINDVVNITDAASIVQFINRGNEESELWIHALVYREHLLEHIELVQAVLTNIDTFDDKECFKLYNTFKMSTIHSSTNKEFLLSVKTQLFNKCNVSDKHEILKELFKDKILVNTMVAEDFDVQMNIMFNKFIADIDVDFSDVLILFYQYPRKVYTKIFVIAAQNTRLIEPMVKLMILLKDYIEYCYSNETEPCMIRIMKFLVNQCLNALYTCNIVKFIVELKRNEIISHSQLLMLVVMPSIHEALLEKDVAKMYVQNKLLIEAFTIEELLPYRAPMLVIMGQMMEAARNRTLETFQMNALKTLEVVMKFQKSVIDTYKQGVPDTEGGWLRQKLQNLKMHPVNFYYYKSLWNMNHKSFFESISGCRVHKGIRLNILSLQLTQHLLPYATLDEWCIIWDNCIDGEIQEMDVLRMFHSSVDVLTQKIATVRTSNTVPCLLYCYGNLVHIIRYKFLREPLTNSQVTACCILLAHNLKSTEDSDIMDLDTILMPLFAYFAERKNDYTTNVPQFFVNTNFLYTVNKFLPNVSGVELI